MKGNGTIRKGILYRSIIFPGTVIIIILIAHTLAFPQQIPIITENAGVSTLADIPRHGKPNAVKTIYGTDGTGLAGSLAFPSMSTPALVVLSTAYNDTKEGTVYQLDQNYPNPFNPTSMIKYEIPFDSKVIIRIYNVIGNVVSTLLNDVVSAGDYEVRFNAINFPSGIYFYSIEAVSTDNKNNFSSVKKMILMK
jgi:hypothetical protein